MKKVKKQVKKRKVYKNIKENKTEKGLISAKDIKKTKLIRKVNKAINLFLLILVPLILVLLSALIQRGTFSDAINWMNQNKGMVILNQLFIITIYFAIQFITNKPGLAISISSILYMIMPVISKLKFDIRGEVLLINDLALLSNTKELLTFVEISDTLRAHLLITIFFIVISTFLVCIRKYKINRITSGVFSLLFIIGLAFSLVIPRTSKMILSKVGVNNGVRFAPNIVHEKQGTWLGLYSNYILNAVSEPFGYSKEAVFAILDKVCENINIEEVTDAFGDSITENGVSEKKPNVIVIMSESFFDPTVIPNVKYSEDPIPNFRKLFSNNESGKMISATFGGGTSTVEFELFTGESTEYLPYGTVPYTDLPKNIKGLDTIQRVFKENGYETIALHDYEGSFYNRSEVYPYLGFDEFIESKDMEEVGYYGKYISDYTINKNIELQLEKNRNDNHPLFIWALTMQNHTPFQTSNFTEGFDKIKIEESNLSESAYDKLLAYINGIYESDLQLKYFIDYIEQYDEPTVVLFFGDHMPSLYEIYDETGMITTRVTSEWSPEEMFKMHTTPYFIYDNFSKKEPTHDNITGAVILGNKLLNYVGIKKTPYFYFMDTLNYLALRDRLFVDDEGKIYDSVTDKCKEKTHEHKMLEYDMMYGKNYVKEYDINRKK